MKGLILIIVVFGALGCKGQQTPALPAVGPVAAVEDAPKLRVHPDQSGTVYRYFVSGERKAKTAMSIEKVPKQSRDLVLVVPEGVDLKPGTVVVADLRKAKADGSFPYRMVGTAELDRQLDERFAPQKNANAGAAKSANTKAASPLKARASKTIQKKDIIMFSASWCGVCKQAARWFNNKGIPFTEKDVEKTPGARQEMQQLAQKAGIPASQLSGVPVISVKGKIVQGFNPQTIERLLANLSSL